MKGTIQLIHQIIERSTKNSSILDLIHTIRVVGVEILHHSIRERCKIAKMDDELPVGYILKQIQVRF